LTLLRHRPADQYEPLKDELLALCTSQAESRYVTDRWLERLKTAHLAGGRARDSVYIGRFLSIGAATVLPAVVSAQAAFRTGWWTVAAVGLSLVVALSGGFVEITRSRQRWQLYRRLRNELEAAGWNCASGRPSPPATRSTTFAPAWKRRCVNSRAATSTRSPTRRNTSSPGPAGRTNDPRSYLL
jgi:hypothetical protein